MAEVIWTEPALAELDAIADYIALENPAAAADLVERVLDHVGQLADHPLSGPEVAEVPGGRYRQLSEPPCRVVYRVERRTVYVVHVVRAGRMLPPVA
jgi:addiction module RelE/StbE family toxin